MKKIITVLFIVAALIMSGCMTTEEESPKAASPGEKTAKNAANGGAAEKGMIKKTVRVPYPVRQTKFYNDGYVESYTAYTYDDDMNILREDLFDSFDGIIESVVSEPEGMVTRRTILNARGEVQSWKNITMNDAGQSVKIEFYNNNGTLQTMSEYEYDESGRKTFWRVLDGTGVLLSVTEYLYEGDLNTRIDIRDGSGKTKEYFLMEYENGLAVRRTHYNAGGSVLDSVEYEYSDGMLVSEKYLRANGSVSRSAKIVNDEEGSPIKTEYYDGNGKLKDWIEVNYEYVSEEILVRE